MNCELNCKIIDNELNILILRETRLNITIKDICHSNIGWFTDKTICEHSMLNEWQTNFPCGIYFLWYKEDYCDVHNLFSMKCLYVGKGNIFKRIKSHFKNKDFSEEMLVYFTYFKCVNRTSKYLEQLFLDIYNIPYNISENRGSKKLTIFFTQNEVD